MFDKMDNVDGTARFNARYKLEVDIKDMKALIQSTNKRIKNSQKVWKTQGLLSWLSLLCKFYTHYSSSFIYHPAGISYSPLLSFKLFDFDFLCWLWVVGHFLNKVSEYYLRSSAADLDADWKFLGLLRMGDNFLSEKWGFGFSFCALWGDTYLVTLNF